MAGTGFRSRSLSACGLGFHPGWLGCETCSFWPCSFAFVRALLLFWPPFFSSCPFFFPFEFLFVPLNLLFLHLPVSLNREIDSRRHFLKSLFGSMSLASCFAAQIFQKKPTTCSEVPGGGGRNEDTTRSKGIATRSKCIATRSKGLTSSNKKLLETRIKLKLFRSTVHDNLVGFNDGMSGPQSKGVKTLD